MPVKTTRGSKVRVFSHRRRRDGDDVEFSVMAFEGTKHRTPKPTTLSAFPKGTEDGWLTVDLKRPGIDIFMAVDISAAEKIRDELTQAIEKAKQQPECRPDCPWCTPRTTAP